MTGATTISTIGDLQDQGYEYWSTCRNPACGKTRKADLTVLAERYGRDTTYIRPRSPIVVECPECGTPTRDGIIIPRGKHAER